MLQNRTSAFVKVRLQETKFYSAEMNHKSNKDEQCHFKFIITKLFIKGFSILTFMLNQLLSIIEQLSGSDKSSVYCQVLLPAAVPVDVLWYFFLVSLPPGQGFQGIAGDRGPDGAKGPPVGFSNHTHVAPKKTPTQVVHTLQWNRVFRHL